jgi:hypothetical protein
MIIEKRWHHVSQLKWLHETLTACINGVAGVGVKNWSNSYFSIGCFDVYFVKETFSSKSLNQYMRFKNDFYIFFSERYSEA